MAAALPERQHVYQNHTLDSTRWDRFQPRPDDIIVATPTKSGTTWMQTIVLNLIFQDGQVRDVNEFAPFLDMRLFSLDATISSLEAQTHRRCLKSHLPLDGLPYFPQVKYIVVGRDARDVFMSLWNHYSNYTPTMYNALNNLPGRVGDPIPICPEDIRVFWQWWMTRGGFAWESEGYPFGANLRHSQTWWNFRHLPNILWVHYNDLKRDLAGEISRVAAFLDIAVTPEALAAIVQATSFSTMKQNAEQIYPVAEQVWRGGAQTFINQGTNGRWRDVLTEDDLQLYTAAVARELTPDCARWLEHGRLPGA